MKAAQQWRYRNNVKATVKPVIWHMENEIMSRRHGMYLKVALLFVSASMSLAHFAVVLRRQYDLFYVSNSVTTYAAALAAL